MLRVAALLLAFALVLARSALAQRREMIPTDEAIRRFEKRVEENPKDFLSLTLLGRLHIRRAQETGEISYYLDAEQVLRQALRERENHLPAMSQLAMAEVSLHRFREALELARAVQEKDPQLFEILAVIGDASLALGDIDAAEKAFSELREHSPQPAVLSRLAELAHCQGRDDEAIALLLRAGAESEETGEPSHRVAWYHVRAGELYFRTGRFDDAAREYEAALEREPGGGRATASLAELRGAQKRFDEAIALYEKEYVRKPRPEITHALGDLYTFMGRPAEAKPWHDRALAAYLVSVGRGEVHYLHHLATFYSDTCEDAVEAVKWAQRDFELRQDSQACGALAWAHYRAGNFTTALELIGRALAPGIKDAHIIYHAAMIHLAAGEIAEGQRLLRECAEINPYYNAFHTHR